MDSKCGDAAMIATKIDAIIAFDLKFLPW